MSKKFHLTENQHENLKKRLYELEYVLIPQNSKDIKAAKEQGDLSENAEYDDAKEQQAKLHQEVVIIKNKLENTVIIEENNNKEFVEVGHTVEVEFVNEKTKKTLTLLGEWDKSKKTTSIDSPLGTGMLGKKPGDTIIIEAPSGELTYKIIDIK